nr:unnamed protein product [Digitaria exilis]
MPWWRRSASPSSSSHSSSASTPASPARASTSRLIGGWGSGPSSRRDGGGGSGEPQPRLSRAPRVRYVVDDLEVGVGVDSPASRDAAAGFGLATVSSTPISRSPSNMEVAPARSSSTPVSLAHRLPLPGEGESSYRGPGRPLPSPTPKMVDLEWIMPASEAPGVLETGSERMPPLLARRHTGALCAMKEVNIIPDDAKSIESLKQLEQEIKFLSQFKHENIVQYYGSETIDERFYIYLEYVHPGSIHKDIKGANLLVDINGVVKLADFGMAKHLSTAAPNLSLKGTPYWMAPEVVRATLDKSAGYDLAVDIWSLGCTIIEMFTGKPPWSGLEGPAAMFKVLRTDPPIPDTLSPEGKDFLRCCFKRNPAERPTASKLLEHSFIQNSNPPRKPTNTLGPDNHHGSTPSFAVIKSPDTGHNGARDKVPWKSDSCMRGKHANG